MYHPIGTGLYPHAIGQRRTVPESVSGAKCLFCWEGVGRKALNRMVAKGRIELPTRGFSVRCSTD